MYAQDEREGPAGPSPSPGWIDGSDQSTLRIVRAARPSALVRRFVARLAFAIAILWATSTLCATGPCSRRGPCSRPDLVRDLRLVRQSRMVVPRGRDRGYGECCENSEDDGRALHEVPLSRLIRHGTSLGAARPRVVRARDVASVTAVTQTSGRGVAAPRRSCPRTSGSCSRSRAAARSRRARSSSTATTRPSRCTSSCAAASPRGSRRRGDSVLLDVLGPGHAFGELALLLPGARRSATVSALEDGETRSVFRDDFAQLQRSHPGVKDVLLRCSPSSSGARATASSRRTTSTPRRACAAGSSRWRRSTRRRTAAVVPLTQEDLAAMAGTSRATVNRVLRDEEKRGTVALRRGRASRSSTRGSLERRCRWQA